MQHPTGDSFSAKAGSCRAQPTASLDKLKIIIAQTYLFKDLSNLLIAAMLDCGHDHIVVALQERADSQSEGQDSCTRCPVPFEKAVNHPGCLHRNSRDDAGPKADWHSTTAANGCQADICNAWNNTKCQQWRHWLLSVLSNFAVFYYYGEQLKRIGRINPLCWSHNSHTFGLGYISLTDHDHPCYLQATAWSLEFHFSWLFYSFHILHPVTFFVTFHNNPKANFVRTFLHTETSGVSVLCTCLVS